MELAIARIYFNSAGFTHLEKKHGKWRSHAEQMERFSLLAHAPAVISNPSVKIVYSSQMKTLSAHFWALTTTINKKRIRVIIRQIGNGRKHFFQYFPKKLII
jgi:hypothetical protein